MRSSGRFFLPRLASSFATILGVSVISFVLLRVFPGDPVRLIMGRFASEAAIQAQRTKMGLDENLFVQYFRYIRAFVTGDWGFAYSAGQPVSALFVERVPATLELGLYAFILALGLAVLLALVATYRRRPWVDRLVRGISYIGLGAPPFWLALLLLLFLYQQLHWLPGPSGRLSTMVAPPPAVTHLYLVDSLLAGQWSTFMDALQHLILPVAALAFAPFAFLVRLLRSNLLEAASEPFLLVTYAKGVGRWRAFVRHALPNAFLPTLTVSGIMLAEMLAGSVLVEKIFNWPGIGALTIDAVQHQDFAVVQAFILLTALAYVLVNLAVDLLYGVMDPRVRERAQAGK